MQIVINIPKEFESHFNDDKFKDSLGRVIFDIEQCNKQGFEYDTLTWKYDIEVLEMLIQEFENATVLSEGHGDLIDRNLALSDGGLCEFHMYDDYIKMRNYLKSIPTIIEADKGESGDEK